MQSNRRIKLKFILFSIFILYNNITVVIFVLQVKSLMSAVAPNSLKHAMNGTDGGKDSVCVRTFFEDKMTCVCNVDDIETTRIYTRQQQSNQLAQQEIVKFNLQSNITMINYQKQSITTTCLIKYFNIVILPMQFLSYPNCF